jgi:hypothetical protein
MVLLHGVTYGVRPSRKARCHVSYKYFNFLKSRPHTACPIILHYYVIRYISYYLLTHVIEGKAVGRRRRGKKSKQLLDRWKIEESWQGQEGSLFSNASKLVLQSSNLLLNV